jgi:hypothetical protein
MDANVPMTLAAVRHGLAKEFLRGSGAARTAISLCAYARRHAKNMTKVEWFEKV